MKDPRPRVARRLLAVLAGCSLALLVPPTLPSIAPTASSSPCDGTAPPATWNHVVWIVLENKAYSDIIGSTSAPYLNSLATDCGLGTNYYAVRYGSLANYVAMTSGGTQGITGNGTPSQYPLSVPSIFSQLGTGWRSLMESMPSNCDSSDAYPYAVRHNPAAYYTDITSACAAQDVPLGSTPDISARFTLIVPDLCHDMHDCSVAEGDSWLSTELPMIFSTAQYQSGSTALFITWDEDDGSHGNHVPFLVIAPSVRPGTTSSTPYDHYTMLRTTEAMLGLSFLGKAADAPDVRYRFHLR